MLCCVVPNAAMRRPLTYDLAEKEHGFRMKKPSMLLNLTHAIKAVL